MIYVYPADCTDFSSNGVGLVDPMSAEVTETLNGEWELKLEHPYDDAGKWQRLVEGCILRAPVPAAMTPQAELVVKQGTSTSTLIYKVQTTTGERLHLRSGTGTKYKILGKYKPGTKVIVLNRSNSSWYEVSCPDGKRGYMYAPRLVYVETKTTKEEAVHEIVEPRQLRDQPFRIYRVVPDLDKITVYARHVFYDLLDNMLQKVSPGKNDTGAAVVQQIASGCLSEHDFTFYSDLSSTAEDVSFENINPVEAILGSGGLIEKYGGELARDWFDVFLVERVGNDTNIQLRQGKNLTGISYDVDLTDVVTRIMPTGQDKDGNNLYLPEVYVDSPLIDNYDHPKWIHLDVSEAKEVTKGSKDKKSKSQCYTEMRTAAQAQFDAGCDMPTVTLDVDFVNCADTEEYRQYGFLQNIYLGDSVRVIARRVGVEVSMRMTQYTYDCLTRKYTKMTLGSVADTPEGNVITGRQLPTGIITGAKLAIGAVGTGHLQAESVGSLQVQMAAIQTAHIEVAAITSALIAQATIQNAHIADATITAAKIEDATITAAKIAEATITSACIEKGTITDAEIANASITAAKIALATITSAQIADAAIESAKIEDLAVTAAKIANATITGAKIAQAAIDSGHIQDASITRAKIALLAVGEGQIDNLAVGTAKVQDAAITSAKICDLAVTGAKIANAAITNAKIANASIDTAKIALGAITTALIDSGAVGTAQIADGSITDAKIVELSANRITTGTLSVERLVIVGSDQSIVYTINEANGTAQLSQTTIDGGSLTQRSISADRIVAGAITANEIAAATILANNIAAGAVTTEKLAASSVDASKIKAGSITTSHLSAQFGEELDLSSNRSIRMAVDGIQVGGRNLLLGSETGKVFDVSGTGSQTKQIGMLSGYGRGALYPVGTKFAVSYEAKASRAGQQINGRYLRGASNSDHVYEGGDLHTLTTEWQRFAYSGIITASGAQRMVITLYQGTAGDKVFIRRAQVETGDRATDWKPAPEDVPIAGRNLATGTGVQRTVAPQGTNNWCSPPIYTASDFGMDMLADLTMDQYRVSFDYAWTGADTAVNGYVLLRDSENSHNSINAGTPLAITAGSGSGHCSVAFTPTAAQRQYGTTWMLSGMGTGNRDIQITLSSFKFEIGDQETPWSAAPEDLQETAEDALSSAQSLQGDVAELQAEADAAMDMIRSLAVGGVNLIEDSEEITITGTDSASTSYRTLAAGLLPDTVYTLSMESAVRKAGSAAGMTLEIIRSPGTVFLTKTLDFSGGHQKYTFTTGQGDSTYEVRLYAGIKGAGSGRVVQLRHVKLETGTFATMWTEARADAERKLLALANRLNLSESGLEDIVTHVTENVDGTIESVNAFFGFSASDPNNPTLTIGSSNSPMTMKLTNSRLSFFWRNSEVAYFSDNKLYVTNVEAIERMSIGTGTNGYLDIVTTATGVGFLWRS